MRKCHTGAELEVFKMYDENLLWSAGRDLALLRRCANPEVPQTETFNNIALFRRLLLDGGIHTYWKYLRPTDTAKFQIHYSSIRTNQIEAGCTYLVVLTGDQWSDLLLGGKNGSPMTLHEAHAGMTYGSLNGHMKNSVVLAHDKFKMTPEDIIKYHAYTLGEIHLGSKDKQHVKAYDDLLRLTEQNNPIHFGNNGASSLALKGFLNRITRSGAFQHMFNALKDGGFVPSDVEYPEIRVDGLREKIMQFGYDSTTHSLQWTHQVSGHISPLSPFSRVTGTFIRNPAQQDFSAR